MADNIKPEIIAVIAAAIQALGGGKILAVKIKRNENWALSSKINR